MLHDHEDLNRHGHTTIMHSNMEGASQHVKTLAVPQIPLVDPCLFEAVVLGFGALLQPRLPIIRTHVQDCNMYDMWMYTFFSP